MFGGKGERKKKRRKIETPEVKLASPKHVGDRGHKNKAHGDANAEKGSPEH